MTHSVEIFKEHILENFSALYSEHTDTFEELFNRLESGRYGKIWFNFFSEVLGVEQNFNEIAELLGIFAQKIDHDRIAFDGKTGYRCLIQHVGPVVEAPKILEELSDQRKENKKKVLEHLLRLTATDVLVSSLKQIETDKYNIQLTNGGLAMIAVDADRLPFLFKDITGIMLKDPDVSECKVVYRSMNGIFTKSGDKINFDVEGSAPSIFPDRTAKLKFSTNLPYTLLCSVGYEDDINYELIEVDKTPDSIFTGTFVVGNRGLGVSVLLLWSFLWSRDRDENTVVNFDISQI